MGFFGSKKSGTPTSRELTEMVEKYYKRRGLSPADHQLDPNQGQGWWVEEGSARIYILLEEDHVGLLLRVTSSIARSPANNREAFFRRLLEINQELSTCSISLLDDLVLVGACRPVKGLDQDELNEMIWNVSYAADKLDDELIEKYGALPCGTP